MRTGGARGLHPIPAFLYCMGLIVLIGLLLHPFFLIEAFMIQLLLIHQLGAGRRTFRMLLYALPFALVFIAVNPLLSQRGAHILFYLFDRNITLEAIVYGALSALFLLNALLLFEIYRQLITPPKFFYLFSRMMPKIALTLMMAFRFFPLLRRRVSDIALVQRSRGISTASGGLVSRLKSAMQQAQILLTWSLEESLETAMSMESRGFGTGPRSTYQRFRWSMRDRLVLLMLLLSLAGVCAGWLAGYGSLMVYPSVEQPWPDRIEWLMAGGFALYAGVPVYLEGREWWRWR